MENSVLIPPIISLTYEFDFIRIKIAASKINFENKLDGFKSKKKTSIKTIDTKFWIKSKEIKDLHQDLKIIEEGAVVKQIKAKGESNINTLINTYLIEYVITKFKIPKEIKLLIL